MQPDAAFEKMSTFDLDTMSAADAYKLLASTVMPRPIAWVVTLDALGTPNAAPYSFFNLLSTDPPLAAISFSAAPDRDGKDSFANLRETNELVIHLVSEELAPAMNLTATDAPRGVNELELAGLRTVPSEAVKPPRIAAAPVALESRLFQIIETGGSSTIALVRIVRAHVRSSVFTDEARLLVDPAQMQLIGRMNGGGGYCTTRDTFTLTRKTWPLR